MVKYSFCITLIVLKCKDLISYSIWKLDSWNEFEVVDNFYRGCCLYGRFSPTEVVVFVSEIENKSNVTVLFFFFLKINIWWKCTKYLEVFFCVVVRMYLLSVSCNSVMRGPMCNPERTHCKALYFLTENLFHSIRLYSAVSEKARQFQNKQISLGNPVVLILFLL